jgi:hypothetical protein
VLRVSLHPRGLAPRIANYGEWRKHLLERLQGQVQKTGDPVLAALLEELGSYPAPEGADDLQGAIPDRELAGIVVPLRIRTDRGTLSFISTTTVFGTPLDVTLADLAIESFFPADAATGEVLRQVAEEASKGEAQASSKGLRGS